MRMLLAAATIAAILTGCSADQPSAAPAALAVNDARITLSPVPGRPAAAYLTLAGGPAADRLTAIASPRVATVELHEGGMKNGMMTMARVDTIDVPADGETKLAPGGYHAMLFGVDPAVKPGSSLPLTLRFASGAVLETNAAVRAAGTVD